MHFWKKSVASDVFVSVRLTGAFARMTPCATVNCYSMWACSDMSGQDCKLSETFETMVTTHLISTLSKSIDKWKIDMGG